MDNLNNKLITRQEVENILNYFENIGDNGTRLAINNLEHYQQAFIHESYYQSVQYHFTKGETVKEDNTLFSYVPKESSERLEYLGDHILKAVMRLRSSSEYCVLYQGLKLFDSRPGEITIKTF